MNKNERKPVDPRKGKINLKRVKIFTVYRECELLSFLEMKMPELKTKKLRNLIANQYVSVGGAPVTQFAYKLYPEDEVLVSHDRISKKTRKELPIMYEDEHIIVMDKPSGLLSIASDKEKGRTAYRLITDYVTQRDKNARIFVVHRLDEDTSGVLIFAKSFEVKEAMQNNWQDIVEKRGYYAIVEGEDISEEGHLVNYLAQNSLNLMYVTKNREIGKRCVTDYKKIASKNGMSLLDIDISTGRKNQIRVQLGNIGHHVVGDDKYGDSINPIGRLGLHAYELKLTNPLNGKKYDFKSQMPKEFKKLFFKQKEEAAEETRKPAKRNTLRKPTEERGKRGRRG